MEEQRVLVVDDSQMTLDHIRSTLEGRGYVVNALDNPLEMAESIRHEPPAAIVLDIMMPLLTGDKVVSILKRYRFSREIPIVLYSALEEDELRALAERTGAAAFVKKTQDHADLLVEIDRVLAGREGEE